MRDVIRATVCALGVLAIASAARGSATLTPLGVLPSNGNSGATGVSADGSVVVGSTSLQAFRWTAGTGMVGLGDLPGGIDSSQGLDVSADGSVVVGFGNTPAFNEAFRWTGGGGMVGLGFAPGDTNSGAFGANADGSVIVGNSFSNAFPSGRASRWTAGSGMVALPFLPGDTSGAAFDVSADGSVVVGRSSSGAVPALNHHAFRWTAGSGTVSLGSGIADAVSADGLVVVGRSNSVPGGAFRWTAETGMVSLGTRPGVFSSYPTGVSADGSVIVGGSGMETTVDDGWVWTAGTGMLRLWDLLAANGADPAAGGWVGSLLASDVSADGRTIVGYGIHNGRQEAFAATVPEPASAGLIVLAVGTLSLSRSRRGAWPGV